MVEYRDLAFVRSVDGLSKSKDVIVLELSNGRDRLDQAISRLSISNHRRNVDCDPTHPNRLGKECRLDTSTVEEGTMSRFVVMNTDMLV